MDWDEAVVDQSQSILDAIHTCIVISCDWHAVEVFGPKWTWGLFFFFNALVCVQTFAIKVAISTKHCTETHF